MGKGSSDCYLLHLSRSIGGIVFDTLAVFLGGWWDVSIIEQSNNNPETFSPRLLTLNLKPQLLTL